MYLLPTYYKVIHCTDFRMEKLNYNDHYKILREAVERSREPDIKIVCGDGVYVVNSAQFKFASSFWIKVLGGIPDSNSDAYIMIAPDISVESIYHIGNDKVKRSMMF